MTKLRLFFNAVYTTVNLRKSNSVFTSEVLLIVG